MQAETQSAPTARALLWAGYILSALPSLMLVMSGVMMLVKPAFVVERFTHLGYDENLALGLGIVELGCTIIYWIPRTNV
ncbi:MAG: DoxX family protein, partial [Candidatus Acidiferrum sp.]